MTIIVALIGFIVMGLAISVLYEKQEVVKTAVLTLTTFLLSYVVISGFLFWINKFTINGTLVGVIIVGSLLLIIAFLVFKRRPRVSWNCKSSIIPLILFLVILPVSFQKFGFFGMGQDQGVYQTKAIALLYGYTDNTYDLDEIDKLVVNNEQEVAAYKAGISEAYGFNIYQDTLGNATGHATGEGAFHGIPTYPAVLALWGSIFGCQNMGGINTLFILCAIFLIYYTCLNLKLKKKAAAAVTFLFAISPVLLWVTKSTLTENVTILIMMAFMYLLTDREHDSLKWLSFFPITAFAFLHVSVYVMMPMFVIIYFVYFLMTGQKKYMISSILITVSYKLGYLMMMSVSQAYTEGNYDFIQRLGISQRHIPLYTTLAVVAVVILSLVMMLIPYKKSAVNNVNKLADSKIFQLIMGWVARFVVIGCAYVGYKYIKHSDFSLANSTMYAYCAASAVAIIPLIILTILVRPKLMMKNIESALMGFLFFYCVIIYATVLSPYVIYYNYYSRYVTVYLAIVLIFGAVLLSNISVKKFDMTKVRIGVYGLVTIFAAIIYFRYDVFMINNQDESRMDWEVVESVTDMLDENDILIVDGDIKNQLLYTTKIMSGAKVFPVIRDVEYTIQLAKQYADHVYYIKEDPLKEIDAHNGRLDKVYEAENHFRIYDKDIVEPGQIPYTLTSIVTSSTVAMYKAQ